MTEEEMRPYTIGLQPCGSFRPTKIPIPLFYGEEVFCGSCADDSILVLKGCVNCKNFHHEDGYDSCDHKKDRCWCWKCLYEESISLK